jgi:hypothetical protein
VKATRRLERGYERLSAGERFRLTVAAEARADSAELERLLRSCPRLSYRLCDPAFGDRCERSFELTMGVLAELQAIAGKLDVVAAAEQAARVLFAAAADEADFEAYRITGHMPAVRRAVRRERGRFRGLLRRVRRTLLTQGATLAQAFAVVCREELEVDPQQLFAAVAAPYTGLYEEFLAESADADALEAMRAELSDAWRIGISEQPDRGGRGEAP